MIKRIFGLAMLGLLLLPTVAVQAQSLKVGYTDHEVLILNMPEYRTVQQQLQQEYQGSQSELQTAYADYQAQVERYQKQQALLSEEKRQEREQELMAAQQTLQQRAAEKDEALSNREVELMSPLFEKVDAAIRAIAEEKGLDIVLRSQAGPSQPIILYVNESKITDITPDVARRLGLDVGDQASN